MTEEVPKISPTPEAALALVQEFLRCAVDERNPAAARLLMTVESTRVAAFDPIGLLDKEYAVGEPFPVDGAVIIPVGFGDASGLKASAPMVVVLEEGQPRIDVQAGVEMMLGGQIHYVGPEDVEDETGDEAGYETGD